MREKQQTNWQNGNTLPSKAWRARRNEIERPGEGLAACRLGREAVKMAEQQLLVVVIEVHTATFTVLEEITAGALAFLSPRAVAIFLETVLPHIPKIVVVDVALMEIGADRGASRYRPVAQHRSHLDTGATMEEIVAHFTLVRA